LSLLGLAALSLERDELSEAAELAERYLRRFPDPGRVERSAGLELAIRAFAGMAEWDRTSEALRELREIAKRTRTRPLLAAASSAEGAIAAARGDHDQARRSYEDALDLLAECDARFEAARVRLDLAVALNAVGRHERARRELKAALADFQEMGASGESARALSMLEHLGTKPVSPAPTQLPDTPLRVLSGRELEVLGLVAEGLTNHDIAERLVLSEHTVNRHVANILRKLGLPSRAAAASLAGRYGLGNSTI
jgi:DNA-binding NarL/FixJ family response regulator